MKREMRWHDFGTGREASRSQYREYWQGERQGGAVTRLPQARLREWRPSPRLRKLRHPPRPRLRPKAAPAESRGDGPKLVPARRVAAKTGGAPQRGAGAPLAGMRPRRCAPVLRIRACFRPAPGSHPSKRRLEPAPPCAGHFVGRLDHAPRTRSRAAWCGQGRGAACGCDGVPGLMRLLPQTGLRQTSRSRRDMLCTVLRVSTKFGSNAHVFHYVRDSY